MSIVSITCPTCGTVYPTSERYLRTDGVYCYPQRCPRCFPEDATHAQPMVPSFTSNFSFDSSYTLDPSLSPTQRKEVEEIVRKVLDDLRYPKYDIGQRVAFTRGRPTFVGKPPLEEKVGKIISVDLANPGQLLPRYSYYVETPSGFYIVDERDLTPIPEEQPSQEETPHAFP